MMKKVLYGVALTLLAGVSVGTLQSCKDDVQDLKTQTSFDLQQLKNDLEKRANELEEQLKGKVDLATLTQMLNEYAKISWVNEKLAELEAKITTVDISGLEADVTKLKGDLIVANKRINALEQKDVELLASITEILDDITTINSDITDIKNNYALKSDLDDLNRVVGDLKSVVESQGRQIAVLENKVNVNEAAIALINQTLTGLNTSITELGTKVNDLDTKFTGEINGINSSISVINGDIQNINLRLNDIDTGIAGLNTALNGLTIRVSTLEGDLQLTKENVEELKQKVYFLGQELSSLRSDLANLASNVNLISENLDALVLRVANVEQGLNALSSRMDDMVTSILIQATDSPVFGNFSLPLGVKSTVLFNWYGYNEKGIRTFPNLKDQFEYNDEVPSFSFDRSVEISLPERDEVLGEVDLGRVYVTLNPVNHYFNNENFYLETSKGEESRLPVKIEVSKSNDELTFGYSRDRAPIEGNGFYAADVKIAGDADELTKGVVATRIMIDENLKTAVKDVLKDRSKRNAVDLLKAVYGQLNGRFPAYALRYNWTNGGNNYSVFSNYDLAVATAKPLSYQTFNSFSTSKRLPTFGHINNIINEFKGKFQIKFDPITFDSIKIELPALNITADSVTIKDDKKLVNVVIDPIHVTGPVTGVPGATVDAWTARDTVQVDLKDLINDLTKEINDAISGITDDIKEWTVDANEQITANLKSQLSPIAEKINNMVGSINTQIDDMITDVANKFDPWFNRLNRVVDLYNKFAEKVNNVLEDPKHYVQVAMFYNQVGSGVGMLSNDRFDPTPFVGGKGYIGLYASSYTAELVAPAYKKYVAVTNVLDKNTKQPVANAATLSKSVNEASKNFNKVVDGNTIRYFIPADKLDSKYIYEIVYQGLDYHGVTSTQKFYITVNK